MPDVSIIIVNWNTRDLLAKCLRSVESTVQKVSYEIYVVDNASTDGSPGMVRTDFPDVKLIANSENVGFARANNQAVQICEGRYVLLLNSDAFVKENTLDYMVDFMDAHPEAGMAGCKLLYEDGRLQPSCTSFPTLATEFFMALRLDKIFPHSPLFARYLMTYWTFDSLRDVDVIMGAFMLVRDDAIKKIGMLDEHYFMYSEEADWCYQFKKAGWKIYFVPDVETTHIWWGSGRKVRVKMHVNMYASKVYFFRKNYGAVSAVILKFLIGLNCLVRLGPGAVYYLRADREKYKANWQLLRLLPGF
jgi:GT2 family glycosyltransferase